MKKDIKNFILVLTLFFLVDFKVCYAAKELVCIYKGGTQNSPTMLIQDASGNFTVKTNVHGDETDRNDKDWYNSSADHEWTLVFDDTNSYKNGELTSCPPYVQHPAFSSYKLAFHDKKSGGRLDYSLIEEYNGTLDENNYKQTFDNSDYSDEINNTTWIAKCPYYDDNGTLDATLYFNRDKYILVPESLLTHKITADFSLYDLLEVYDRRGKCPTLYGDYDCYVNVGNTFCNSEYSLEKSFSNSDNVKPGVDSEINDPDSPINSKPIIDELDDCSSLLGSPTQSNPATPAYYISIVFSVIRYVAIILLIVLTILDFVSAVASQDNDILKKASSKAIKRFVLCVIIFLLPTLIDFVLQFIHNSSISDCIDLNS